MQAPLIDPFPMHPRSRAPLYLLDKDHSFWYSTLHARRVLGRDPLHGGHVRGRLSGRGIRLEAGAGQGVVADRADARGPGAAAVGRPADDDGDVGGRRVHQQLMTQVAAIPRHKTIRTPTTSLWNMLVDRARLSIYAPHS